MFQAVPFEYRKPETIGLVLSVFLNRRAKKPSVY